MRGWVGLSWLFFSLAYVNCKPSQELKEQWESCMDQVGISNDALEGLINSNDPKIDCIKACLLTKQGAMIDKIIDKDKAVSLILKQMGDPSRIQTIKENIEKCVDEANKITDGCTAASAFEKCAIGVSTRPSEPED